jgi:hypothetical protein
MTPKKLVYWLVNSQLKGIAQLIEYDIDFDGRKILSKVKLEGEEESIDVILEDFTLIKHGDHYSFAIQQVQSNKIWLNNALIKAILGREIKIPDKYSQLVQDLFSFHFPDSEVEQK